MKISVMMITRLPGVRRPIWAIAWPGLLVLLLTGSVCLAQPGTWQSHASYQSGQSVAVVGNNIYAATQSGFFYYDKTTGETTTLSRQDGLSDTGISRLLYLADLKQLLIAYRSGTIDVLSLSDAGLPGAVRTINTLATAPNLPGSRAINHLNRIGNNVYLSTDFGLVVLDVQKAEIRDTYFSQRPDGSPLPIYATTATSDSLYAMTASLQSTNKGRQLRAIRFAATVNLADPANWRPVPEPGTALESIATRQGRLSVTINGQGVFDRQGNQWLLTQALTNPLIRQFPASAGLLLATNTAVSASGVGMFSGALLADPREVVADDSRVWVADVQNGLLAGNAGALSRIAPEGPTQDVFARLYAYTQTLVALPGGPQQTSNLTARQPSADLLSLSSGRWQALRGTGLNLPFNSAAYLTTEQRLYLGSYGGGLWAQTEGQPPAPVTLPAGIGPTISSLATDIDGNLWLTTAGNNAGVSTLHVRRPNGTFESIRIVNYPNIVQVVPDDNGFLWLLLDAGGGILVVDPVANRSRFLSTERGNGGLLTNTINALAKDRTGAIWAGTDLGPTVFDNPAGAFDASVNAQPPILNGRRLLANEPITAIAVDGGNRKWLGTRNGLYRVAPDGSQLLETFNTANSPLPNNSIQALAVEPVGGSVFIQTTNGLVSYRGPATEPADALTRLTIFPNPVRPDFTGTVAINGLTDNATVKILDTGGQLVYETRSQGGTASWNLYDYRGRSAQTGVYLVVVVDSNGTAGLAGKLAVVR